MVNSSRPALAFPVSSGQSRLEKETKKKIVQVLTWFTGSTQSVPHQPSDLMFICSVCLSASASPCPSDPATHPGLRTFACALQVCFLSPANSALPRKVLLSQGCFPRPPPLPSSQNTSH